MGAEGPFVPRFLFTAVLVCVAVSLVLALARAQAARDVDVASFDARDADVERGRAIVVGAYAAPPEVLQRGTCFRCHGMDGRGDAAAAFPRLSDQSYKYLLDSMADYASGVRQSAIMGPIAQALTRQQMRDVSAYYAAQADAPYGQPPKVDPTVLQRGAALAAVGSAERGVQGCINCHGPDGGGLPPSYPYLAGQHALYLESELKGWKQGRRKGDTLGVMEYIAKRLTDEEIRAVSAYYASMRPRSVTPEQSELTSPRGARVRSTP
jgi:cytochrome c553